MSIETQPQEHVQEEGEELDVRVNPDGTVEKLKPGQTRLPARNPNEWREQK